MGIGKFLKNERLGTNITIVYNPPTNEADSIPALLYLCLTDFIVIINKNKFTIVFSNTTISA